MSVDGLISVLEKVLLIASFEMNILDFGRVTGYFEILCEAYFLRTCHY